MRQREFTRSLAQQRLEGAQTNKQTNTELVSRNNTTSEQRRATRAHVCTRDDRAERAHSRQVGRAERRYKHTGERERESAKFLAGAAVGDEDETPAKQATTQPVYRICAISPPPRIRFFATFARLKPAFLSLAAAVATCVLGARCPLLVGCLFACLLAGACRTAARGSIFLRGVWLQWWWYFLGLRVASDSVGECSVSLHQLQHQQLQQLQQ